MQTDVSLKQQNSEFVTLIQITDTHIQSDPADEFDGINTRASLNIVLQHIREHEDRIDALLVTGDLVHDPVTEAYKVLAEMLVKIPVPVFCIPGNHDDPAIMEQHLNNGNISTAKHLLLNDWHVCFLNSWLPGTHAGHLPESELQFLDEMLATDKTRFAMVVLHHPPVSIKSPWMDKMALNNPGALFSIVDQYEKVRGVLWGHIHQEFTGHHKNILLMATPSTCVQFKPEAEQYLKDSRGPGYRVLKLYNDGNIRTKIHRIE